MIKHFQKYQIKQFLIIKFKKKFLYKKIQQENYLPIMVEYDKYKIHKFNGLIIFILQNNKNMTLVILILCLKFKKSYSHKWI